MAQNEMFFSHSYKCIFFAPIANLLSKPNNFYIGHFREHLCELILNLRFFPIWKGTVCTLLVDGIMGDERLTPKSGRITIIKHAFEHFVLR